MSRKTLFSLVLFALISFGLSGQDVQMQAKTESHDTLAKALLWEIAGDSINTSYLFGTIHLIPEEDYFLPPGTEEAIDASSLMVFEIDLQEMMENPMAQMGLFMQAFMSDGTRLRDLLSEEDYKIVSDHFEEMGLPMMIFERVKPMFLAVFASEDFSPTDMSMSAGGSKSYEMEFLTVADSKSMEVEGLESMEFQISVFDSIPYKVQAEMLVESITAEAEGGDAMDTLIAMYKSQDVESLFTVLGENDETMMEYEEMLVSGRNKNWIPIMEEMMQKETVFFAVGAGHLGGQDGVIRLLKRKGYTLRPVSDVGGEGMRQKQRF